MNDLAALVLGESWHLGAMDKQALAFAQFETDIRLIPWTYHKASLG